MDESLEQPNAEPLQVSDIVAEESEEASEDEDGGLDWTKLLPEALRPVIPKRGEKEYEPRAGGGSNLQVHVLERSRAAMIETLKATRATSSKFISYAVWHPQLARAEVTLMKGSHFSSMGHSAPRTIVDKDGGEKLQKRLELLPEEAVYLIERGSMFCWKESDLRIEGLGGAPMTVQQAYSEMIGTEDMTLEKFQVFAYLKRLGYVVTRTDSPNEYYPVAAPFPAKISRVSILDHVKRIVGGFALSLLRIFHRFDWWQPIRLRTFLLGHTSYSSLFRSLRFIPNGHSIPLRSTFSTTSSSPRPSPYKIFFNVYKPSTPFKRSTPPAPDFQIVVINARTTPMPTLQELTNLFDVVPELPLPVPRLRRPANNAEQGLNPPSNSTPFIVPTPTLNNPATPEVSFVRRFFLGAFSKPDPAPPAPTERRVNPFMALKAGKKMSVIAVVDAGNTGFFRFSEGAFSEWPMV